MNTKIINKLKEETNNSSYIVYREKYINNIKIDIIYNEVLTDQDKMSNFIYRSLDHIEKIYQEKELLYDVIKNNISNIKIKEINNYQDICKYLNNGFVILLIEDDYSLALEVKKNLTRSIEKPMTETTIRGAMDSFTENIETNIGLIKRRLKTNKLWNEDMELGKYTKNKISILTIKGLTDSKIKDNIINKLNSLEIDGVTDTGTLKHLIENETKTIFPTSITTERPDKVASSLLRGKTVIIIDNCPFALIMPVDINDFFLSQDDKDSNYINNSLTRILRYLAFFITVLTPGIYIALTTFNQEMIPLELLTSFASQRSTVPFPAFFEALLMFVSFEILRESDYRIPNVSNSALSIVGALILGEAAVNAGIVSPIMIIIVAITAISALVVVEPELSNAIKWYRILFMLGGTTIGIFGIFIVFIIFTTNLCSINSYGKSFTMPFTPINSDIKNSIIKFPLLKRNKRNKYLTNNIIREVSYEKN
ncbi:MAG: spore germination protein [Firmicutes bacterium]|nr:spore germination protein [Bacillota bacterium]MDY5335996.1 spore germination protein [Bacilli bacterium]